MATPLTRAEWLDECAKLAKTYEEAMTDEAKALVERLRWGAWYYEDPFDGKEYASDDPLEAADLIETQAREIERLRGANQAAAECVAAMMDECARYRNEIRAALGDSHEQ